MDNLKLYEKPVNRLRDFMNQQYFYDRVYYCIVEDGNNLKYGDFVSKILANGFIRVAKSLGIYMVKGRGDNKKVYMHPKLIIIIETSSESNKEVSQSIIKLLQGKYENVTHFNILNLEQFNCLKTEYNSPFSFNKCTYLIFNPINNLTKIGKSSNVKKRLNTLKNQFENKLILIGFCKLDIESKLHQDFSKKRVFGEWFELDVDDILDIKLKNNVEIYNIPHIG